MVPPNCKWTVTSESPSGIADSLFSAKKQKHFNASLFLDSKKWPFLNRLWNIVSNYMSEAYLKSQDTIKEYILTTCVFFDCLCLNICGLHLYQLMIMFCAIVPIWYGIAAWIKKFVIIETFEKVQI